MSEAETLQSLDNVLTRLALTDEAQLEKLKAPGAAIRNKVLQILSHVNKRLDAKDDIQLPLVDLVALLKEADSENHAMIRSFALVYIEKASEKSTAEARLQIFPQIMTGLSKRPAEQRTILLRVGVTCLEDYPLCLPRELPKKQKTSPEEQHYPFLQERPDRLAFLESVTWTLLFQTKQRAAVPKEITQDGRPVEVAPEVQEVLTAVPSGLSVERVQAVEGKLSLTEPRLMRRKLGVLCFLNNAELDQDSFLPFLISSADSMEEVRKEGEGLMKKHFRIERDSKDLDLNDPSLIQRIFDLFQGSMATWTLPTTQNVSSYRTPASHALKAKLMGFLVKSTEAANCYPHNIQMLHELLGLLREDVGTAQRGYVYEAIGQLAQRLPSAFQGRIDIAEDLFRALETEPAAFQSSDPAVQELLMKSVHSESSAVRLVSVTWSMRLFPFRDPLARYICVVGAGDDRPEVQSEAQLGLQPGSFSRDSASETTPSAFPSIPSFMHFLHGNAQWVQKRLGSPSKVYQVLIGFLRRCHFSSSTEEQRLDASVLSELLKLYEGALNKSTPTSLVIEAMEAMVSLLMSNRQAMAVWCGERLSVLKEWLHHTSNAVRVPCAQLIGWGATLLVSSEALSLTQELRETLTAVPKSKFEVKSGSIQALGYLTASCEAREVLEVLVDVARKELSSVLSDGDPHLRSTAALAVSHQLLHPSFFQMLSAAQSSSQSFLESFSASVRDPMLSLCRHSDFHIASQSVLATGLLCKGLQNPEMEETCLMSLVNLQNIKHEELQSLVGEALALGCSKGAISSDWILLSNYTYLRKLPPDAGAQQMPEVPEEVHGRVVDALLKGMTHSRSENRAACVSHFVTLLTYIPRHRCLLQRLETAQNAFLGLLGDKNGLTQEMASRGVSLVYSLGDESTKAELLSGLTSVLKDPSKRSKQVKVEAETEVFAEGELGKIPGGGSLTTYKELCSLATDMGQPDLLYKFMDIANHQAALNSRRGAAVGFGHIAELAGEDLKPYLTTLLPRIYRLQFDPNPAVQETMQNIWQSLVPKGKEAVEEFVDGILKELLKEITARPWRNRESSAKALADALQGRTWPQLRTSFSEIWRMAFRAADDIKESVRLAGVQLLKTLKRVTLRFSDPHVSDASTVAEVVSSTFPVLLEVVMRPKVPMIVAVSFATLSSIASSCPGHLLRPHLPLLVPTLLESLSNLEAGKMDELQLNAENFGIDPEKLESLRVRASSQSPAQDVLTRCLNVTDAGAMEPLMPKLKEVIQRGVGLNTRVGTARYVTQLTVHLSSDLAPFASKLLKLYLNKGLSGDANLTLKKAYTSTLGALCKVASSGVVEKVMAECVSALKGEEGDAQSVAMFFKELHSQAPQHFSDHAPQIVPIAFLHRFESSTSLSALWGSVLEEGMGTENGTLRLYHAELVQEVKEAFQQTRWTAKAAAAKAIERMYEVDRDVMKPYAEEQVQLLLDQLPGRLWDGKEALMKALACICHRTPSSVQGYSERVTEALKEGCSKGKRIYRETALECLSEVLASFERKEALYDSVAVFLLSAAANGVSDQMETTEEEATVKLPLAEVIKCLASSRSGLNYTHMGEIHDAECFTLFHQILTSPRPWNLKLSILESLITFLSDSTFPPTDLSIQLEQQISGVFVCLEEQKYEQLRGKALEALEAIHQTAARHNTPLQELQTRLAHHMDQEKSFTIKNRLELLLTKLRR